MVPQVNGLNRGPCVGSPRTRRRDLPKQSIPKATCRCCQIYVALVVPSPYTLLDFATSCETRLEELRLFAPPSEFRNIDTSDSLRTLHSVHHHKTTPNTLSCVRLRVPHCTQPAFRSNVLFTFTRDAALDLYFTDDIVYWYHHPGLTVRLHIWRLPSCNSSRRRPPGL
ncbi:hypothetical protein P171DRAFT_120021 [Karstenula rhodostoma CBS 690.94]|uniref:Uncharacterized protein n=1 Tax=Karstenula rhodostoma CBS 690.94 TaxID=1392251 RepID=A0A9P4P861_9PLEO|nr:hypothetical protein P171DRAFT_120021 [Karstenula rhodostoma CBS 690.94]